MRDIDTWRKELSIWTLARRVWWVGLTVLGLVVPTQNDGYQCAIWKMRPFLLPMLHFMDEDFLTISFQFGTKFCTLFNYYTNHCTYIKFTH